MRDMSEAEADAFEASPDHTNAGQDDVFCCPHCVENVAVTQHVGTSPKVAACSNCGEEFAVWVLQAPMACSAKLDPCQ